MCSSDLVNNFNPRSKVVLNEIDELLVEQPMDETRDDVAVLDTPQVLLMRCLVHRCLIVVGGLLGHL